MRVTVSLILFLLAGCSVTPQVGKFTYTNSTAEAIVWPTKPDIPRYRYIGELTGEKNYPVEKRQRSFLERIVGLFEGEDRPVILQRPHNGHTTSLGITYVADTSRQAVFIFDPNLGGLKLIEEAGPERPFQSPVAIAETSKGTILVSDADLAQVSQYTASGEYIDTIIDHKSLNRPTGIAIDKKSGNIYVSDTAEHIIKVFTATGDYIRTIGKRGEGKLEFNFPTYLHITESKLYVTDAMNARVQILTHNGEYVDKIGNRGSRIGDTPRPKGITTDSDGNIYIIESYYDHVLIYNENGDFLLPIGGAGQRIGKFYLPAGVWSDQHDRVYIADMFNGRIFIMQYLGGE